MENFGTLHCSLCDTAIGACALAWRAQALVGTQLPEADADATLHTLRQRQRAAQPVALEQAPAWVQALASRLQAALQGQPTDFRDLPLDMGGAGAFYQRVWRHALGIPWGQTRSYAEVACALNAPNAARAVGQALGANPFAPLVPCHRVLAASGRSGGFSAPGGARTKLRLLEIEGALDGPGSLFGA